MLLFSCAICNSRPGTSRLVAAQRVGRAHGIGSRRRAVWDAQKVRGFTVIPDSSPIYNVNLKSQKENCPGLEAPLEQPHIAALPPAR